MIADLLLLAMGLALLLSGGRSLVTGACQLSERFGVSEVVIGMTVVAEGIETRSQAATLQACGVTRGQGFLFARPMPIISILDLVAARQTRPETSASADHAA